MKHWLALVAALFAGAVQAQTTTTPTDCFPPPIDKCGKGAVHGTVNGVEYTAWWVVKNFDWSIVHYYRMPGFGIATPPAGTMTAKEYAAALWKANVEPGRSCFAPHAGAIPACNAMFEAIALTRPPPITYDVAPSTALDKSRPGHTPVSGVLKLDGTRHLSGTWCECWRAAIKPSTTQFCKVTATESYAACVRTQ